MLRQSNTLSRVSHWQLQRTPSAPCPPRQPLSRGQRDSAGNSSMRVCSAAATVRHAAASRRETMASVLAPPLSRSAMESESQLALGPRLRRRSVLSTNQGDSPPGPLLPSLSELFSPRAQRSRRRRGVPQCPGLDHLGSWMRTHAPVLPTTSNLSISGVRSRLAKLLLSFSRTFLEFLIRGQFSDAGGTQDRGVAAAVQVGGAGRRTARARCALGVHTHTHTHTPLDQRWQACDCTGRRRGRAAGRATRNPDGVQKLVARWFQISAWGPSSGAQEARWTRVRGNGRRRHGRRTRVHCRRLRCPPGATRDLQTQPPTLAPCTQTIHGARTGRIPCGTCALRLG